MNKKELVALMAEKGNLRKKDAELALNAIVEVITEALKKEDRVEIRGFGTFLMKRRSERTARNPKTGEVIKIPAKLVPVFKPGKELKEATEKVLKKSRKKK